MFINIWVNQGRSWVELFERLDKESFLYAFPIFRKQSVVRMDPLLKLGTTDKLDKKTEKSLVSKVKNLMSAISEIERSSGLKYPPYYVEPLLRVVYSNDNVGGLGVLYARTIPVEIEGKVQVLVEITAPLLLYATKATLRLVLAHEFLHYIELVRNFTRMDLVSQITSSSMYEERHADYSRAVEPSKVFSNKNLVRDLRKRTATGLDDEKLNEKCKVKWIEKGLPVSKISMAQNQVHVSMASIMRSTFDPGVKNLLARI